MRAVIIRYKLAGRGGNRRNLEIVLYWSEEDGAFIAEVPELSGCAADGATRQEALANAELVISEWMRPPGNLDALYQSPRAASSSPDGVRAGAENRLDQLWRIDRTTCSS